jgi:hypothetical protein
MGTPLQDLRDLATGQDGQFALRQARELELSPKAIRHLVSRGDVVRLRDGVLRFTTTPGTPDAAVTAYLACWPHAVISHESAAQFHGLRRVTGPEQPVVTVPHNSPRRPSGVVVHRSRNLENRDILRVDGVRYTTLARTVCDLACADDPWETLSILDDAVARGARSGWIHHRTKELARGRDGLALLREATHPDAAEVFRSWLERASSHVYRAAHLPEPEWNVPVYDEQGRIGIVDALWLPWRVISEKEGLRFHTTPKQRRDDARRFNRLSDAGYTPRRFTWEDVVHDPVNVATTIHRALRAAGADLDPATIPRRIVMPGVPFVGRWD